MAPFRSICWLVVPLDFESGPLISDGTKLRYELDGLRTIRSALLIHHRPTFWLTSVTESSVTLPPHAGKCDAPISTHRCDASFQHRAATLPEVRNPYAAVRSYAWTGWIRLPHVRVPEVRPRSCSQRVAGSNAIGDARLACRRTEAADMRPDAIAAWTKRHATSDLGA